MKLAIATALAFMFIGCATEVQVPEKVYVPTRCQIEMPTPPTNTGDPVTNTTNLLIYTELLETNLEFCVNGTIPDTKDETKK